MSQSLTQCILYEFDLFTFYSTVSINNIHLIVNQSNGHIEIVWLVFVWLQYSIPQDILMMFPAISFDYIIFKYDPLFALNKSEDDSRFTLWSSA